MLQNENNLDFFYKFLTASKTTQELVPLLIIPRNTEVQKALTCELWSRCPNGEPMVSWHNRADTMTKNFWY